MAQSGDPLIAERLGPDMAGVLFGSLPECSRSWIRLMQAKMPAPQRVVSRRQPSVPGLFLPKLRKGIRVYPPA